MWWSVPFVDVGVWQMAWLREECVFRFFLEIGRGLGGSKHDDARHVGRFSGTRRRSVCGPQFAIASSGVERGAVLSTTLACRPLWMSTGQGRTVAHRDEVLQSFAVGEAKS